ncbi:MAG: helix-turn-helix transcriptional regulator [Anaerolineales bacterium]|nr:helix-turn-helix transcriptional regulator [Anaerolineales bacterium]
MKRTSKETQNEKLLRLLKRIRQERGIRQVELANRLGLPQSFVSKYESGDRRLDILELRKVCEAIGIPFEEFIRELEENLNEPK